MYRLNGNSFTMPSSEWVEERNTVIIDNERTEGMTYGEK